MKSPKSRDEVLEVGASPLQHAQEMDGGAGIVLADILRQLLNSVKVAHGARKTNKFRGTATGRLQRGSLPRIIRKAKQLYPSAIHFRAPARRHAINFPYTRAEMFGVCYPSCTPGTPEYQVPGIE